MKNKIIVSKYLHARGRWKRITNNCNVVLEDIPYRTILQALIYVHLLVDFHEHKI